MCLFQNDSGDYEYLSHYTDITAVQHILLDKTLKCNSFKNLNDLYERSRKGIENIIEAHFTACFCHAKYEIVPFWYIYGGRKETYENKVMLQFLNFSSALDEAFETDYALGYDEENTETKIKFNSDLNIAAQNGKEGQVIGRIKMLDVDYRDKDDPLFDEEYAEYGSVYVCPVEKMKVGEVALSFSKRFNLATVGKYKTESWRYEQETRILVRMTPSYIRYFEFILLRMKEEIFRGLTIVTNPWASDNFIDEVKNLVESSNISDDIKNSIKVQKSTLHDQLIKPQ